VEEALVNVITAISLVIHQGNVEVHVQEVVDMVVVEDVQGLVADHMRGADVEDPTPDLEVADLEVVPEKDLEGKELVQGQELDQDQGIDIPEVNRMIKTDQNQDQEVGQGKTLKTKENRDQDPEVVLILKMMTNRSHVTLVLNNITIMIKMMGKTMTMKTLEKMLTVAMKPNI